MKERVNTWATESSERVGLKIDEADLPAWFREIELSINDKKEGY